MGKVNQRSVNRMAKNIMGKIGTKATPSSVPGKGSISRGANKGSVPTKRPGRTAMNQ